MKNVGTRAIAKAGASNRKCSKHRGLSFVSFKCIRIHANNKKSALPGAHQSARKGNTPEQELRTRAQGLIHHFFIRCPPACRQKQTMTSVTFRFFCCGGHRRLQPQSIHAHVPASKTFCEFAATDSKERKKVRGASVSSQVHTQGLLLRIR